MKRNYFNDYISLILLLFITLNVYSKENVKDLSIPDTIRIVGNTYCPPYDMINEKGVPDGFCVDLIKEVMHRLHKPYTLKMLSRDQIMKNVRNRQADLVLEMTYSEKRAKLVHFGTVYNYASRGALYHSGSKPINSFKQFKNKTIAVERNSYSENLLKQIGFNLEILSVKDHAEGVRMVQEGKCDALFCNLDIAQYITRHNPELSCAWIGLPPEKFCIAGTNAQLLNQVDFVIYQLKQEGVYGKMLEKWMPRDKSEDYLQIIYIGLIIISALVIFLAVIYFFLHYKIISAKKLLQRNRQNLDMSLRAGDIGIWEYDLETKLFRNIFCDYFPPEGRTFDTEMKLVHPDDQKKLTTALQTITATGNPTSKPMIIKMSHEGEQAWHHIEIELHPMKDEDGKIIKIVGTHKDVTDKITKDKKINELLNEHEIIFNHTSIGTIYYDAEGYMLRINKAACTIFGIADKQALIDKHINLFEDSIYKSHIDRQHIKTDYLVLEVDLSKSNSYYFGNKGNEGKLYIGTNISPVYYEDGRLRYIIINNSDLTERETLRKQVEEYAFRMKYILKSSGVLTWTYNPFTQTLRVVDEREQITKEVSRSAILVRLSEEEKGKMDTLFTQMDHHEIGAFSQQVRFNETYLDDQIRYYTIDGIPVKDIDGKVKYYLGLSIDITQLIEIQNNLQHEKEEAQKADKLKSAFLANVSHEIRTPLNAIVGFSDMLQYAENDDEKKQFIDIIKSNNDRLLKIIDDVLDMSKIEAGTMKMNIENVDLEKIFGETYQVFTHQLSSNGSSVKMLYKPEHISCILKTDRLRFNQVLTNFITNAIKYTTEGHIRIGYKCTDGGVRIFVEDSGQGIPRDKKDHVFDRFEKLDSFVKGTGLGLSICKDIATMFHGKIGVESDLGKGSQFWMWIPAECDIK